MQDGEDISRSEGEVDRDVVAALLEKIRRPPPRRVPQVHQASGIHDSPSVGELLEEDDNTPGWSFSYLFLFFSFVSLSKTLRS